LILINIWVCGLIFPCAWEKDCLIIKTITSSPLLCQFLLCMSEKV